MSQNKKLILPQDRIKETLASFGMNMIDLSSQVGASPNQVSIAIRCAGGVGPGAVELRKKIAETLQLDASQVWDEQFMTVPETMERNGYAPVKPKSELTDEEWGELSPSERVRALLVEHSMTIKDLAEEMEISYRKLTNSIYGKTASNDVRRKVARSLEIEPWKIWPEHFVDPEDDITGSINDRLKDDPEAMASFLGFGFVPKAS